MNMKYFRFLFEETNNCFIHFGELTESDTEERASFLYLRGTDESLDTKNEGAGFVCPEHVDLVVLGCNNPATHKAWERLSKRVKTDVLIVAGEGTNVDFNDGEVIRLTSEHPVWCGQKLGWRFFLKSYEADSVVMLHGPENCSTDRESKDCVMNIKPVDVRRRCCTCSQPDGYGCALGCVLHQDYDVCKYRGEGQKMEQLTGMMLVAKAQSGDVMQQMLEDLEKQTWNLRFLAISKEVQKGEHWKGWKDLPTGEMPYKHYYISMDQTIDPVFAGAICESGFYHVPVVLQDTQGLCCSGLMKY